MGAALFKHAGFSYLDTYHVEGDKEDHKDFHSKLLSTLQSKRAGCQIERDMGTEYGSISQLLDI